MNDRLPNPSSEQYRHNLEKIFHIHSACGQKMEITPWRLAEGKDLRIRYLVCRMCREIMVEHEEAPATK